MSNDNEVTHDVMQVEPTPEAPEAPKAIKADDIQSAAELRNLLLGVVNDQTEGAKQKIAQCGYVQAVQTELALNRTDLLTFSVHVLLNLVEKQQMQIHELRERVVDLVMASIKKGGKK